jgi:hypothetical protein
MIRQRTNPSIMTSITIFLIGKKKKKIIRINKFIYYTSLSGYNISSHIIIIKLKIISNINPRGKIIFYPLKKIWAKGR